MVIFNVRSVDIDYPFTNTMMFEKFFRNNSRDRIFTVDVADMPATWINRIIEIITNARLAEGNDFFERGVEPEKIL